MNYKLQLNLVSITILLILLSSNKLLAQSGSNDPQFNSAGVGFNANEGANSALGIIVQPSGKIILGNTSLYNGVATPRIVRINPDGDIDPTFNPGSGANNTVGQLETQSTGKIIASGTFTQYSGVVRNRIARLNSDGSLDLTFDAGTAIPGNPNTIFVQPDDKILVAGHYNPPTGGTFPYFIRLNQDGSPDPSFNTGSNAINIYTISIQPDNKLIVCGSYSTFNGTPANSVVRLNPNGSIDPTFSSGLVATALPYNSTIQPDGKILITGAFPIPGGSLPNKGVIRLNTDGSQDLTFNGFGFNTQPYHILRQADGKFIISGIFSSYNGTPVGPVMRLNADGSLDNPGSIGGNAARMRPTNTGKLMVCGFLIGGYGYKGIARMDQNSLLIDTTFNVSSTLIRGANDAVRCVALQPDNKIVIGGVFDVYNGMNRNQFARLNPNGGIDPTFNIGTGPNADVISMRVQPDGKIVIGGGFGFYNSVSRLRIARILPDGSVDMSFNPGTGANNIVVSTELQPDGKILIGGFFTTYNGTSSNRLARLNSDGSYDGTFNIGTGANGSVYATPVQTDGKIIVAGTFTTFNGVSYNRILRLNADGTIDNSFTIGTGASGSIYVALIQPDGKIIIGGQFTSYNGTARKNIARLNSDGTLDLTFDPGTGVNNNINTISLQSDGKIIIGGQFSNYNGIARSGIARVNTDGSLDLTFNPGNGINSGGVWGSSIQPDGNIVITGGFTEYNGVLRNRITRLLNSCPSSFFNITEANTSCYGVADGSINLTALGGTAPFSFTWNDGATTQNRTGLSSGSYSVNITDASGCTDSYNNIVVNSPSPITPTSITQSSCGTFNWNGQILSSSGIYQQTFTSLTGCDSLVTLNLTVLNPTTGIDIQSACSSFTWIDGNIYTTSTNIPTFVLQNAAGCDSTVTLHLTILSNSGIDTQTACDSFDWIDGNTYTSSTNTPTFVLQNAVGCDSIVTLNLTITHSTTGTDVQTACDSYDWIDGNTYTSSTNTPTFVLQNAAGCDSIVTLNLTITHSTTGTDVQTACDSFDWIDGNTYTSSTNTPTFVLQNAVGCDSTVTLNLTITHSTTGTDVQTACDSFDWIDGNTYTSSTSTPTFVLQNAAGCDSIVTLNLTITHSTTGTDVQTACDSFDWIDGNTYTSSTNTPTFVLQNAVGCDSTVTLNLTITHSTTGTDVQTACDSFDWIDGNTYTSSTNTPTFVLQNAAGCDSTVTLNLTITASTSGTDVQTACDSFDWIDGNTYTSSTNTPTFVLQNAAGCDSLVTLNLTIFNSTVGLETQTACGSFVWPVNGQTYIASGLYIDTIPNASGCDSIITLDLTIIPSLPLTIENVFVFPSDANSCVGEAAITVSGNAPFELDFDNGSQVITSSGYSLVTNLCTGVHDLHVTDNCGDTLSVPVVIPVDSNFVFNNPFIDSLALDSLGVIMTNCDIFYNGIDTAYIDSIWTTGNTVNVIWNIVDSNGSNFDTTSYALNNGNGVYWVQLSVFCPFKSSGEYFTVTEAIYFLNGSVSTAGLEDVGKDLFEVYPNPTNDRVYINFSGSDAELIVYDVQGKMVMKDQIQNHGTVSLQNFERGVYLFNLKNSQGHHVQRIVKQ